MENEKCIGQVEIGGGKDVVVVVRGGVLGSDPWAVPGARVGRDTTSFAGIAGINHERKSAASGTAAAAAIVVDRDPGIAQ